MFDSCYFNYDLFFVPRGQEYKVVGDSMNKAIWPRKILRFWFKSSDKGQSKSKTGRRSNQIFPCVFNKAVNLIVV